MTVTDSSVSMTGTSLPTELVSVFIGLTPCTISSNDETSISCTLDNAVIFGTHYPEVRDEKGLIPISNSLEAYEVALVVDSTDPSTDVNPAGQSITIFGSGFPSSMDEVPTTFQIAFGESDCTLTSSSSTEMTCTVGQFTIDRRRMLSLAGRTLFVTVSESTIETTTSISLNSDPLTLESITPSSASPILTETLTLQLGDSYDTTNMAKEDFSVVLIPRDDSKVRPLNVVDINSDDGTLDVKYGGAYSGVYDIQVSHTTEGSFLTSGIEFEAKIQVESFSPTSGSKFGGTLITITGGHFSDDI